MDSLHYFPQPFSSGERVCDSIGRLQFLVFLIVFNDTSRFSYYCSAGCWRNQEIMHFIPCKLSMTSRELASHMSFRNIPIKIVQTVLRGPAYHALPKNIRKAKYSRGIIGLKEKFDQKACNIRRTSGVK